MDTSAMTILIIDSAGLTTLITDRMRLCNAAPPVTPPVQSTWENLGLETWDNWSLPWGT